MYRIQVCGTDGLWHHHGTITIPLAVWLRGWGFCLTPIGGKSRLVRACGGEVLLQW